MNGSGLKKITSGILAMLILAYVGYQVFRSHYTPIRTETISYFTASNSVQTSVVALRREIILSSPAGGAVDYIIGAGSKVSKGGTVAKVYKDESQISAQHQLEDLDSTVSQLKSLQQQGNVYSFNADTSNERICGKLTNILDNIRSGDMMSAFSKKSALLDLLNEKQIGSGQVKNFSTRINELEIQRKSLVDQAGHPIGSVVAPEAGYFIQSTDGMENAFDLSKIDFITCADVKKLQSMKQPPVSGTAGKINRDFNWYLVCTVSGEQYASFRQAGSGSKVSVRFPFVSGMTVSAEVEAINPTADNNEAAVVLQCKEMNAELAGIRRESADISLEQYTGLRVSQKAVHYATAQKTVKDSKGKKSIQKKEVEGVYVLHGNQLDFCQIVPKFSTDTYVICDANPDANSLLTAGTVKYSDEVVVEGTDLYDGKVVK